MAHKSKTQRAKASAARAARKARAAEEQANVEAQSAETEGAAAVKKAETKSADNKKQASSSKDSKKAAPKKAKKPGFLREVRAEMKRVTWPTKQDVLRWSGVVVAALVFFSVFVLVLDNLVVTPILFAISGLGA